MPGHFEQFTRTTPSPGVLVVREGTPIRTAIEEIVLIWTASDVDDWVNRLVWIPL